MKELQKIVCDLISMEYENNLHSEIKGKMNWCIRTEHYKNSFGKEFKFAVVGRLGRLRDRGFMLESVENIRKYHVRWYIYTYKEDFEKSIARLAEEDFRIRFL